VTSPVGLHDTIVAIATAIGRSAIALIRVSGPQAFEIARRHVSSWPETPRVAHLSDVSNGAEKLDEALITLFPSPNSFTGEDIVEISTHGGHLVPVSIVAALTSSGARQALPGEFTRRAVLNGKLDIIQAEAIGDLIDASSHVMQRTALNQLDGGLSRRLAELRNELLQLEALIAYDVDFPEEDDGPIPASRIGKHAESTAQRLQSLLATAPAGEVVREGVLVVIAGPPNAGKSSLFNALIGRSRAIVTEIPGTTRDALEAVVDSGNWPLRLVDTAGLRETHDRIERLGVEVSERYLAGAHVVLACSERDEELEGVEASVAAKTSAPIIRVRTKADLVTNSNEIGADDAVVVSALAGSGLPELLGAIDSCIDERYGEITPETPVLTRARHRVALTTAHDELKLFTDAWMVNELPIAVAAVHLRTAVHALEELIGTVDVEEVLDRVFSSFCVGK
jgi:tRNA modification GTPase